MYTILMVLLVNKCFYPRRCPCGHVYYNGDPTHALLYIAKLVGIVPALDPAQFPEDMVCPAGIPLSAWVVREHYFDVSERKFNKY